MRETIEILRRAAESVGLPVGAVNARFSSDAEFVDFLLDAPVADTEHDPPAESLAALNPSAAATGDVVSFHLAGDTGVTLAVVLGQIERQMVYACPVRKEVVITAYDPQSRAYAIITCNRYGQTLHSE